MTEQKKIELNGWIDAEKQKPELIDGKDYSENVLGWDGLHILVVSFSIDSDGWHWANAYGDVWGDAEFDDDYDIKLWQPILIPKPPTGEDEQVIKCPSCCNSIINK